MKQRRRCSGGTFTQAGYIESSGANFIEHYNGRDIPAEYRLLTRPEPSPEREGGNDLPTEKSPPLAKNKDVQELPSLMEANNLSTAKDLRAVVEQVTAMENQLNKAVGELAVMRREFAQAQNHPFQASMRNTVDSLQVQVNVLRERLADLKENIIAGCRDALAAVKDKGLSALRNVTEFFKVEPPTMEQVEKINKQVEKMFLRLRRGIASHALPCCKKGYHQKQKTYFCFYGYPF